MTVGLRWQPVVLGSSHDSDALLAFSGDRLVAVVSKLGELHDELVGWWFVEATFEDTYRGHVNAFRQLADVEAWITKMSV